MLAAYSFFTGLSKDGFSVTNKVYESSEIVFRQIFDLDQLQSRFTEALQNRCLSLPDGIRSEVYTLLAKKSKLYAETFLREGEGPANKLLETDVLSIAEITSKQLDLPVIAVQPIATPNPSVFANVVQFANDHIFITLWLATLIGFGVHAH